MTVSSDDLEKYQSENLFLLIGKNPLPNYVAAKLLTKPFANGREPTIHLVFSQGQNATERYAANLRTVLENDYCLKNLPVNPSNQKSIYNSVKNRVEQLIRKGETSIGLNYTGGTKAMTVHAYNAVKDTSDKNIKPTFSYLDSREMKMCIDREADADRIEFPLNDPSKPYFDKVSISLENLLKLHGQEIKGTPRNTVRFPEIVKAIQQELTKSKRNWENFREKVQKAIKNCEESTGYKTGKTHLKARFETCLCGETIPLNNLADLPKVFQSEKLCENGNLVLANLPKNKSGEEFCNLLNGAWLEDYALGKISDIAANSNLNDCFSSVVLKHPDSDDYDYFEIDVAVIRGYQLFIITCAYSFESNKAYYKGKIFEALLRAEQLGGSEAKVALVCMASDSYKRSYQENGRRKDETVNYVNLLKQELNDPRVKIFGKEDLLDEQRFSNGLKEWFEGKR